MGARTTTLPIDVKASAEVAGRHHGHDPEPDPDRPEHDDLQLRPDGRQRLVAGPDRVRDGDRARTGWTITTKLADAQAASTVVKAGSSTTVTVAATPPQDAPAGHTDIAVTVTAGSKTVPGTLGIDITGSYKVTLSTPNQLVSAHGPAGSGTTQQIVVKNDGTAPLTNVAMSATQPTNWTITYDTSTIPSIAPGRPGHRHRDDHPER